MNLEDESLIEVARSVWECTLSMVVDSAARASDGGLAANDGLCWAVDIAGAFEGTVVLCVSEPLARAAAAAMLDRTAADTSLAEANEVVAELTNMIGGNIKGLIEGSNRLSLPRAARPTELLGPRRLRFSCSTGDFTVAVNTAAGGASC